MAEVNLFIYDDAIESVVLALARLGTLEIEEDVDTREATTPNRWVAVASTYGAQERRLRDLLDALGVAPAATMPPDDIDLEHDQHRMDALLNEAEQAVNGWRQARTETRQDVERLRLQVEQVRLLAPLDLPVERLSDMHSLHLTVGTMPTANLARIQTALFRIPFVIIPTHTYGRSTLVFAATPKEHAPILDRALHSAFFEPIPLPEDVSGPPAQVLEQLAEQQAAAQQRLANLEGQHGELVSQWGEKLIGAWNRVQACRTLAETIQRLPVHGRVYVVAGWVPAHRLQQTTDAVQKITDGRAIIEVLEPGVERPQVPTALRNPPLLRAFETLVTNYGIPAYQELDPTLVVAVSFLLMYGIMFGDVGHGLLLALAGLWLTRRAQGVSGLGPVLILAGLSAALFGVLYGTVLGMPLIPPLWLRPSDSITTILLVAVAAGVVLINLGFGLFLLTNWRVRNWERFLLDKNGLVGLALYWALLGGGIALWRGVMSVGVWAMIVVVPATALFLREPLGRWMTEGRLRPQGSWGEFAVLAFFELFETVLSFFGNSLSFVRLGAFAVAHEALSRVVLLIAGLAGSLGWLVIVLGAIFIVAFEGLIVGIQALRLEYYEFFGRFFRGDGRAFKPLAMPQDRTEMRA